MVSDIGGPRPRGLEQQDAKSNPLIDLGGKIGQGEKHSNPLSSNSSETQTVNLSNQAQSLKSLEEKLLTSDDVDLTRVDVARTSIADGSYTINAEKIAERLLGLETELAGF